MISSDTSLHNNRAESKNYLLQDGSLPPTSTTDLSFRSIKRLQDKKITALFEDLFSEKTYGKKLYVNSVI